MITHSGDIHIFGTLFTSHHRSGIRSNINIVSPIHRSQMNLNWTPISVDHMPVSVADLAWYNRYNNPSSGIYAVWWSPSPAKLQDGTHPVKCQLLRIELTTNSDYYRIMHISLFTDAYILTSSHSLHSLHPYAKCMQTCIHEHTYPHIQHSHFVNIQHRTAHNQHTNNTLYAV